MKKTLTTILCLLLIAVLSLTLFACGSKEEKPQLEKKAPVSQFKAKGEWPTINDPLSWEDINSYPIKTSTMAIDDARQLCVDFFRYSKTACWIPDENFTHWHNSEMTNEFTQEAGKIYGGVPYIPVASGNIYRLMDFMDEEKGVVDISEITINPKLYGNQCSIGSYWGWARVINSPVDYSWTEGMVQSQGFLRVGPYTYDENAVSWSDAYRTTAVTEQNGEQTMFESYALLKKGDGIVYFTTAGHVVMIAEDAVVVRNADGTINGGSSYVKVIDQTPTWLENTNAAGDKYLYEKNVDAKWDFNTLLERYVPFTYAEWTGENPIEQTEVLMAIGTATKIEGKITENAERKFETGSAVPKTLSSADLFKTTIASNYGISDVYCTVYDEVGNEVYKTVTRAGMAGRYELKFSKTPGNAYFWGVLEELPKDGKYTAKIEVQLGTGERPVLWEGEFTIA